MVGQIIKGCSCERDKKCIEQNTSDLNVVILHFRTGVQSDSTGNLNATILHFRACVHSANE